MEPLAAARRRLRVVAFAGLLLGSSPTMLHAQSLADARWIWGDAERSPPPADFDRADERWQLQRTVTLPAAPQRAFAWVSCDNRFQLCVNGSVAGRGSDWSRLERLDLTHLLRAGDNLLLASCRNEDGPAGFLLALEITQADGTRQRLVSDAQWTAARSTPKQDPSRLVADATWQPCREIAPFGSAPWGELQAPPAPTFDPLPGFALELVADGFGSVVALANAGPGRQLANVEGGPIFELIDADRDGRAEIVRPFTSAINGCQGIHWQAGATWFTGAGPDGHGLYRLADGATAPTRIVALDGDLGEHGPHAIVPGPDGALYLAIGNHARLGQPPAASSPYRLTYEGHLLPTMLDPNGHATECKAPGGVILRVDPVRGTCELFAAGFRNHYDLAFDKHGELFTFDSDMEWDVGLPWYRPLHVVHVVPGGEYGWRTGSSVWPVVAADSLPPTLPVGRGSPTGMCLCTGEQFPARFRGALLAGDWSVGVIYAFRATPHGASYATTAEVLLRGHPLNVTDLAMDDDGSLLFATGGRGTVGGVHRLKWVGAKEPAAAPPVATAELAAPLARRFATAPASALVEPLGSPDRFVRFLAARELERRPAAERTRALGAIAAAPPLAQAEALLVDARLLLDRMNRGERPTEATAAATSAFLRALELFAHPGVEGELRHALLRALELWRIVAPKLPVDATRLLRGFPCNDPAANRDWAQLLGQIAPPGAAAALWQTFAAEPSREQKIAYADALRCVTDPWPDGAHIEFHRWLDEAIGNNTGGMSYVGYLTRIRDAAAAGLSAEERAALEAEVAARLASAAAERAARAASAVASEPREFDRVLTFVERTLAAPHRSLPDGGLLFQELCSKCHLRGTYGKAVGPDLTTLGARFGPRDVLESMLAPSRTISDQYRGVNLILKNGDILAGMPLIADEQHVLLVDTSGTQVDVPAAQIERRRPATKSVMPEGLLDALSYEQIADLAAWLLAPTITAPAEQASWRDFFGPRAAGSAETPPNVVLAVGWQLVDGVLRGATQPPDRRGAEVSESFGGAMLLNHRSQDFVAEFEARLGGEKEQFSLLFRGSEDPTRHSLTGYAVDGGGSAWGRLRELNGRGVIVQPRQEIWWPLPDRMGWNHFLIEARGDRITVRLNGSVTVDNEDHGGPTGGAIGFELPNGVPSSVQIRHARVRPLAR